MNAITSVLLTLLTFLFPALLVAQDPLGDIAATKRAAAIKLATPLPGSRFTIDALGVFISNDGLALLNLSNLALLQKPKALTVDGAELPLGTILGVFPDQELALVKYNHRPKVWTPIAPKEPGVGNKIAVSALLPENWSVKIPPIVGPVMSKQTVTSGNLRALQFQRVLSLGSGISRDQRLAFVPGSFAVNEQGQLVGVKAGIRMIHRQTLIMLAPVASLADKVTKLAKDGKAIPFPLPEASNPIDPALLDPAFRGWDMAVQAGDRAAALKSLEELRKRFPNNSRIKGMTTNPLLNASGKPIADLSEIPRLESTASVLDQYDRLRLRANFLTTKKRDAESSLQEMLAVLEVCPKDLPEINLDVARLYHVLGKRDEAEKYLRAEMAIQPETIEVVRMLEGTLEERGKLDEARTVTDRLLELERLYHAK